MLKTNKQLNMWNKSSKAWKNGKESKQKELRVKTEVETEEIKLGLLG